MCILPNVESIAIFGGMGQNGRYLNDLYVFICLSKTWNKVKTIDEGVEARSGHSVSLKIFLKRV